MIGRIIDGRYRIQSLVAIGGMGRVYKAEQSGLGRTVAIKVLSVPPSRQVHDPHFRERFALEAAMASRLTSPNTITIFHYGRTDDDIYYIVMEYVEGLTLGRLLKREGRLSIVHALTVARQVCLSLREAHARGIVHRDIKPSNIMLINGDHDQVKVLDFGIAKQMVREADDPLELTSSRSYIGTPEYMAPEYFDGRVDTRSDIYSLGVVLYVALTGHLPFKGKTSTQTILMALHEPAPAIDPTLGLPAALEALVFACLEKDPDHRPSSVDEILHALQLCLVEVESGGYDLQSAIHVEIDAELPPEELFTPTRPFTVTSSPTTGSRRAPPPTRRGRRARHGRIGLVARILAGTAMLSVGIAGALFVRFLQGKNHSESLEGSAPAPASVAAPAPPSAPVPAPAAAAPPAAPVPAPAAAASAPAPAPDATQPGAVVEDAETSTADAAAAAAGAVPEEADPAADQRARRSGERARADKPARASAPAATRKLQQRPERGPSSVKRPRPDDPVPEGYKPSPY